MDLIRGDEGGDTDLMFQFCLPKQSADYSFNVSWDRLDGSVSLFHLEGQ